MVLFFSFLSDHFFDKFCCVFVYKGRKKMFFEKNRTVSLNQTNLPSFFFGKKGNIKENRIPPGGI